MNDRDGDQVAAALARFVKPGGHYIMVCGRREDGLDVEKFEVGPTMLRLEEAKGPFERAGFRTVLLERVLLDLTDAYQKQFDGESPPAWLLVFEKVQ